MTIARGFWDSEPMPVEIAASKSPMDGHYNGPSSDFYYLGNRIIQSHFKFDVIMQFGNENYAILNTDS